MRNHTKQAGLSRLIRQVDLIALDGPDANAVGLLLARIGTADVVDAYVAVCARGGNRPLSRAKLTIWRRFMPQRFELCPAGYRRHPGILRDVGNRISCQAPVPRLAFTH